MSLGYALGLLALAGVPAILAIHRLRVRARRVAVSTLFLVPRSEVDDPGGRRFERLRVTPLLCVQILAVLLLTWILVEPRWLREDSTVRVVTVLDGSASMSAFAPELPRALEGTFERVEGTASAVSWIVLASDPREKTLYAGASREEALAAALSYRARLPGHDPGPVLSTARSLASETGLVLYVTDRPVPVPPGVELLSVGSPIGNVGFAGLEIAEDGRYRALVKSSSARSERRRLGIERERQEASFTETLVLEPLELRFVSGTLDAGEESRTLVLESDDFTLDDRLPMIRPRPKLLRVFVAPELSTSPFVARFLESLAPVEKAPRAEAADLVFARRRSASKPAILLASLDERGSSPEGSLISESDPLTDGLNFQGLLVSRVRGSSSGRALLWRGDSPLVLLEEDEPSVLSVRFALEESNADRIPAFVLLLHRYAESVRQSVPGFEHRNVELGQLLPGGGRAPREPGFFEAREGENLLRGAARFGDVREGDFTGASPQKPGADLVKETCAKNSLPDPLRSLWLLVLLGLTVAAGALQERPSPRC